MSAVTKGPFTVERWAVVGQGPVGRSLVRAGRAAQLPVAALHGRTLAPAAAAAGDAATNAWDPIRFAAAGGALILAVPEPAIAEVAARLVAAGAAGERTLLLHAAGALDPAVAFASVRARIAAAGLLHPLRAFAASDGAPSLAGTLFAVAGDAPAVDAARAFATAVGGHPVALAAAALPAYHAAAVLASNHTLALVDAAVALLTTAGFARRDAESALAGLLATAADNVAAIGLPAALTGPIARGDADRVAAHLAALDEPTRALYRATGRRTLAVARAKGAAPAEALDRIARLLDEEPPPRH